MQALDTLLAPLGGPHGCGEDLGFSAEFDRIRDMRREDDTSLAQGDWIADVKTADWVGVSDLCGDLIATRSKDLRLANWYAEAQTKLDQFAGLAHGCAVIQGLVERFWDGVFPEAEDGDQELRIGTLSWFVGRSTELIRGIPLTQSPKGAFSLANHESARLFEAAMEKDPDLRDNLPDGKVTVALIGEAQRTSSKDFYRRLIEQIAVARTGWTSLAAAIDIRLGVDGPSFRDVFDAFAAVENQVQRVAREQGAVSGATAGPVAPIGVDVGAPVAEQVMALPMHGGHDLIGPIVQRQQALQALRQVADFFERTEPHSPVTYLARKAADWGDMPLHQWLAAVIKDGGTLSQVNELLGVAQGDNP
jgi:type VI secretion system protein ImpA